MRVAPTVGWLIAARTVQGAGGALVMTLALALVGTAFPPERRGWALGIFFAATGLAVASGPLVGGAVVEGLDWQWIFWLNVPIGAALVLPVLRGMPESHGPDTRLDLPGVALVTLGMLGLVWGLVRGNPAGWGSAEVVGALAGGAVLVAAFVAWELRRGRRCCRCASSARGRSRRATRRSSSRSARCSAACSSSRSSCRPGWDADRWPRGSGSCRGRRRCFVAPVAGTLVDRLGERPFMVLGPLLQAVGMGWIALIAEAGMPYGRLIAPLLVAGVGISMSFPAAQNAVVGAVPPEAIGKATGTNTTLRELGGVFGIALSVAFFAAAGSYASPVAFTDGFVAAMGVAAALSLLAACAGALLPSRERLGVPAPAGVDR